MNDTVDETLIQNNNDNGNDDKTVRTGNATNICNSPEAQESTSMFSKLRNDPSIVLKWCKDSNVTLEQVGTGAVLTIAVMIPLRDTLIVQTFIYWVVHPIYHLLLRILGVSIGIGFGLGLAAHVYDQLDAWKLAEEQQLLLDQEEEYDSTDDDEFDGGGLRIPNSRNRRKKLSPRSTWNRDRARRRQNGHLSSSSSSISWDMSGSSFRQMSRGLSASSKTLSVRNDNNRSNGTYYEDDEQTYASLMKSAGYSFIFFTSNASSTASPTHQQQQQLQQQQQQPRLRGQVIRSDNMNFQNRLYNFAETRISEYDNDRSTYDSDDEGNAGYRSNDDSYINDSGSDEDDTIVKNDSFNITVPIPISKAVTAMNQMWPTLPVRINEELGRAIEYIVRDFVAVWFCKCDYGCVYEDPEVLLKGKKAATRKRKSQRQQQQPSNEYTYYHNKRMLYSMAVYRPMPFLDSLYESMTTIFGNLATRVENVNVFELVLLKWVQVLAHTFKVYRALRKNVLKIQQQQQQQQATSKIGSSMRQLNFAVPEPQQQQGQQQQSHLPPRAVTASRNSNPTNLATTNVTNGDSNAVSTAASAMTKAATQRVKNLRNSLSRIRSTSGTAGVVSEATTPFTNVADTSLPLESTPVQSLRDETMTNVSNHGINTSANENNKQKLLQQPQVPSKYTPVSEMAMTKEFLFAGKLHKAVTFGLDVKALLFSDSTGRDCGVPLTDEEKANGTTYHDTNRKWTDDEVLERRLFNTQLILECELDYNRVLGHQIVRTLIPRADYSCSIVRNLLTEIMGGSVLTPIMSIFSPEYINSWIIAGLVSSSSSEVVATTKSPDLVNEVPTSGESVVPTTETKNSDSVITPMQSPDCLIGPIDQVVIEERGEDGTDTFEVQVSDVPENKVAPAPPSSTCSIDIKSIITSTPSDDDENATTELTSPFDATDDVISADDHKEHESQLQEEGQRESHVEEEKSFAVIDKIYTQLAMALIDLQRFVDFDEFRNSRMTNSPYKVDWDNPECRTAAIRLVLVIEAAISHGRCTYKSRISANHSVDTRSTDEYEDDDNDFNSCDGDLVRYGTDDQGQSSTRSIIIESDEMQLSQILMELTSDMDAFEDKIDVLIELEDEKRVYEDKYSSMIAENYQPTAQEQSTMRTLIAAWLHSGQSYRAISLLMKAQTTVLAPFYRQEAFMRNRDTSGAFLRQFIALVDVGVLVDTMSVLGVPRLEDSDPEMLAALMAKSTGVVSTLLPLNRNTISERRLGDQSRSPSNLNSALVASAQYTSNTSSAIPRYLDFNRNESFAASLRTERERRLASWERLMNQEIYGAEGYNEPLPIICGASNKNSVRDEEHLVLHRELHHLARIFYTGTNMIAIRDASRRKPNPTANEGTGDVSVESSSIEDLQQVSLVTVETACSRRRLEVPDDDSSFLLRAQPRPLNAVGVHRDQRNHDQSFKCFASTYDEPALPAAPGHYTGGRYIRRCLVRYYPIDRTATVSLPTEAARKLDQRKNNSSIPDVITVGQPLLSSGRPAPFLSAEYLRDRHLCQRWVPKGTTRTQSILASNVMEPTDFTSIPRSGKAIDFVYRMNFYERPMLDLSGKHFTIHDSASLGAHRADASALELSDATISVALLLLGLGETPIQSESGTLASPTVEMGMDGYPVVWMKFSRKQDSTHVEVKPYRTSFVRAALMVTAARQEAQLQGLIKCVKDGSAKQASKALTDAALKQTAKLLEYATSRSREKQSLLQRDLKLGVNHIDQGQLRRNGLLLPRYPTSILSLSAFVEDVVQSAEMKGVNNIFGTSVTVFRIKCSAKVAVIAADDELEGDFGYRSDSGVLGEIFQEEWIIYRTMKEFQTLHKHLKNEVSAAESSGTASSRLVGAATAAFAVTNAIQVPGRQRQKRILVPSLSQASKAGALGVTRKLNAKRKEILDNYLEYLLSPGHLIGHCTELLLFLGAFYPFPSHARVGVTLQGESDPLGRTEMLRTILKLRPHAVADNAMSIPASYQLMNRGTLPINCIQTAESNADDEEVIDEGDELDENSVNKIDMIPSIKSKIERVHLSEVRNRLFELLRYQFGFENASFIRNRMLQALKTVSFAVAGPAEFRKMLYKAHLDYINADSIAGWIKKLSSILWPEGVFFSSAPPSTAEELKKQANEAKEALHSSFPAEVRAILGQDLTRDGMDILFEMLQNRMVLKSMAYMLFDLLWLEVFPELGDILTGGVALDIDSRAVN